MNLLLTGLENLKISAFSKYSQLTGDINNVTIGPNSSSSSPKKVEIKSELTDNGFQEEKVVKDVSPKSNGQSLQHILKEYEIERREKVNEAVNNRYLKFQTFTKAQQRAKQAEWLSQQHAFINYMQENEEIILQAIQQYDVKKTHQNEELIKHYQNLIERKLQYEKQIEEAKEKQRILNENIEKISKFQLEFRTVYQEIISIIKTCVSTEDLKEMMGEEFKVLKILLEGIDEIVAKCKSCNVQEQDVVNSVEILNKIEGFKLKIKQTVEEINYKKNTESQLVSQPTIDAQQPIGISTDVPNLNQCISVSNYKMYIEIKQFLIKQRESYTILMNDEQQKQFKFDCKKAVNIPVNAISSVNSHHLRDKYTKLANLLSGKTVIVADKQINASNHPQGIPFCMDLLAKKFVLQGDLMVSSNPEAAFGYATVIVSLWNDFPEFGNLLLAYFYIQCPYVVPFYIPKIEGQSDQDYYITLGYQYTDGQIEKQHKFIKRMTGIFRLYFAILIAKPRKGQSANPHNIKQGFRFLASLLKLEPQMDITATALHVFLETVGFEMEATYGSVFRKLIQILIVRFMPQLKKIDSGGPVARLEGLLEDYRKTGKFPKPSGLLPDNFW